MCGIFGIVDLRSEGVPGQALLRRMGHVIVHRGPDDEGFYFGRGIALGMRRLSIIDLSGGHQPIANEDASVWVICNGEIYNFQELRARLVDRGHVFRTKSDTEVLVHLYEEHGLDFLLPLRGMFAIALWDARRSRLILARDRIGKKPLYVCRQPNRLLFGSELKCILQDQEIPRRIDHEALAEYLSLGYVPAPHTLLQGVEKVLPGHMLVIENGQVLDREYWDVQFHESEARSEQEWVELVRDKLLESVRLRLISDVPLGAFLSGGIDSSAIVAAMARFSGQPVKTYSIGYEGGDSFYNELPYARIVAKKFATDHHEIVVRPEVSELLPRLIWHMDEPIADSATITTYLVSRLARESVTVILSGVGGDELFGGYNRYLGDGLLRYYRLLPRSIRTSLLPALLTRLPQDRHSGWPNRFRYANAFVKTAELDPVSRYMSYVNVFSPAIRAELAANGGIGKARNSFEPASSILRDYFDRCHAAASLNQNIYVDMKTSLPDDLLALTDKMTMAASIECRAPFMDHELIELSSRIPADLKVRGLTKKYLLKKVLQTWLPPQILHRKKRGFGAPMGAWLRDSLRALVHETLSEDGVRRRGLFDPATVQQIIADHNAQRSDHTDHLLTLITLELWCRIFLDRKPWHDGFVGQMSTVGRS